MTIALMVFLILGGGLLGVFSRQIIVERQPDRDEGKTEHSTPSTLSFVRNQILAGAALFAILLGPSWLRAFVLTAIVLTLLVTQAKQLKSAGLMTAPLSIQMAASTLWLVAMGMMVGGIFLLYEATEPLAIGH